MTVTWETHEQGLMCLDCNKAYRTPIEVFPLPEGVVEWACPKCGANLLASNVRERGATTPMQVQLVMGPAS